MKETLRPSGGAIRDIDPMELAKDLLSAAHNVNTRRVFPSRIGGRRVAYPLVGGGAPNDPYHLVNLFLNTFNWWILFGASNIYGVESSNYYNISISGQQTINSIGEWSSAVLNGIPIFTNGKNLLSYWDGDGSHIAATVPDWPSGTVCKAVTVFKYHVFALNIDGPSGTFENQIKWSAAAEPGTLPASWTPSASNEAGDTILADTPGRCVNGRALGSQLMIYKPDSFYSGVYVGQQPDNIFDFGRAVSRTAGLLMPHGIVDILVKGVDCHLLVGNDDVYITDGTTVTSVADARIKRYLANSIDRNNAQNSFVIHDISNRELWVCVPESGNTFANIAHIWDQARNTWVTRDLASARFGVSGYVTDDVLSNVWDNITTTWDTTFRTWNESPVGSIARVVIAEPNKLYIEDTNDAVTTTAYIKREDLDFGDDSVVKLVKRVWIHGSGAGLNDLEFRLGTRNSTDEGISWGNYVGRNVDGTDYEVAGRLVSIEIRSTGSTLWTVNRIVIEADNDGNY